LGKSSERPIIEMTIPSSLDKTVAPSGKHVAQLFVQYTPYHLSQGSWVDPRTKEVFADRVFDVIEEYAPGFKKSVVGRDILSPYDLETIFGLTGGNIFHSAMGLDQLFWFRPAPGFANYRSPIQNLFVWSWYPSWRRSYGSMWKECCKESTERFHVDSSLLFENLKKHTFFLRWRLVYCGDSFSS